VHSVNVHRKSWQVLCYKLSTIFEFLLSADMLYMYKLEEWNITDDKIRVKLLIHFLSNDFRNVEILQRFTLVFKFLCCSVDPSCQWIDLPVKIGAIFCFFSCFGKNKTICIAFKLMLSHFKFGRSSSLRSHV